MAAVAREQTASERCLDAKSSPIARDATERSFNSKALRVHVHQLKYLPIHWPIVSGSLNRR